ncbi:hypothetical protein C9I57_30800 [Trinickia symbiotica]|uniref:Uncharacterized protein n=1 Tax=Trinickia symbiotica TaxID=863227 RepID=A0A2T3XKL9_9BURK|nr:hypothetical protein [Trinickia symbiotica]PTB16969.1 hypothetical protein C9I57_30800 [Trinickia symbiotica]
MDTDDRFRIPPEVASPVADHLRVAVVTVLALLMVAAGGLASLWLASFFLYMTLQINPLHGGLAGWLDALLAWRDGLMPRGGNRLAGAALLGVLVGVGGPAMGLYALWERTGRRRLYGRARFATGAEIRAAGLL